MSKAVMRYMALTMAYCACYLHCYSTSNRVTVGSQIQPTSRIFATSIRIEISCPYSLQVQCFHELSGKRSLEGLRLSARMRPGKHWV
ncbi:hypothetical protein JB92DRAFT_2901262 [Gautieria morchelliformis]|nr:hypothetical protein JB92DRAFT_2901262 [Gautieria morchelliformis]